MDLLYLDDRVLVCVKPAGIRSTDEPGGLPDLVRAALGDPDANLRTVPRLDQVVGGLMVLARTARAASDLSAQIRAGTFEKEYLAVVHGETPDRGHLEDLLARDRERRRTVVVTEPGPNARPASLDYETLARADGCSLVRIRLHTGRTHQIRVQFSSRVFPLLGDRKYGADDGEGQIALWSFRLAFRHPRTGKRACFQLPPPPQGPWSRVRLAPDALETLIPSAEFGRIG